MSASHKPTAVETIVDDTVAVDLAAGRYTARFLPGRGMAGTSLTLDGIEHVAYDAEAHRGGHPSGIALLYPWANRLSRPAFTAGGVRVELDGLPPQQVLDGLAIHGTMTAAPGWQVEAVLADGTRALVQARFAFGDHPEHLRSFPFPHELVAFVELSDQGLRVTTELHATGDRDVPVSFGWHPNLMLPGVARRDLAVVLPDRERQVVDGRLLPTGETLHEAAGTVGLGDGDRMVTFDDCYRLPGARAVALVPRRPVPAGPTHHVEVDQDPGYGHVQVWAPAPETRALGPAPEPVVGIEPMTAPVDALVTGDHRTVPAGGRHIATFTIRVHDDTTRTEPSEENRP
jgi:aldose 1-epimerase